MTRGLDVELDQHVLVVADAVGLDLVEDFAHQARRIRGRLGNLLLPRAVIVGGRLQDALTLAAAAGDRLQPDTVFRPAFVHFADSGFQHGSQFIDREQVDPLVQGSHQHRLGLGFQIAIALEHVRRYIQAVFLAAFFQCRGIRVFGHNGQGGGALSTPGVTLTPTFSAVRLASSFSPAPWTVWEQGPIKLSPASSMALTISSSSAIKP